MSMAAEQARAGQVTLDAAEIYDTYFVPALFCEWAKPLCEAAGITPGQDVLDVACGTGSTTHVAQALVGKTPQVTGLDCNAGMLQVARSKHPEISFVEGAAEALPFDSASFDAVLCQFGLMFFEDRAAALREMARVAKPGGRCCLSVWDVSENSPGYGRMIALLDRLFGPSVSDALRAPFVLGEKPVLRRILDDAGWAGANIKTRTGTAQFRSIADWVRMDVRGWTLSNLIDDDQYDALVDAAKQEMSEYAGEDGTVSFAAPAHIVTFDVG